MGYTSIDFFPGPRVVSIALNRPALNIINIEMMDELNAALDEAADLNAQIVVFSGKGDRGFSAGVEIRDHAPEKVDGMLTKFHRIIERIRESDVLAVAAIHGHTLGGGAELALACDFIVAATDTSIGFPEIDLGCYPPFAAAFLGKAVGLHKASEMVMLGKPITAQEAERIGLVNKVVAREKVHEAADQYVDELLTKSSAVLALTKRALRLSYDESFGDALRTSEDIYRQQLTKLEDMQEGLQSFLEKRPPAWKNR